MPRIYPSFEKAPGSHLGPNVYPPLDEVNVEQDVQPMVPPAGASGDGADARTPLPPRTEGYSNGVPMPDNMSRPGQGSPGWQRSHGLG